MSTMEYQCGLWALKITAVLRHSFRNANQMNRCRGDFCEWKKRVGAGPSDNAARNPSSMAKTISNDMSASIQ